MGSEDTNNRWQIFLFLFKLGTGPSNLTAGEFAYNLVSRKNRDGVLKNANSLYR